MARGKKRPVKKTGSRKAVKKATKSGKTLAQYKKELDTWFSIYIRMRDKGVCITCGSKTFWKYHPERRFLPRGIRPYTCSVPCCLLRHHDCSVGTKVPNEAQHRHLH